MSLSTHAGPTLPLNDGHSIPQLGLGVFEVPPEDTEDIVAAALQSGYRLIDTAAMYDNEDGVGRAVAACGIPRSELFVTTKVWNDDQGAERTRRAFDRSLERLGLDYVDLYLIHWPAPAQDRFVETWETLVELRESGRVRSIGVSNFLPEHLERVIGETGHTPAVNQVELHPRLQQPELRALHERHRILTEAWSPLGRGQLLDDERIAAISRRVGRTPAQVVLRWHIQLGNVAIPRTTRRERLPENAAVFDFELSARDMEALAGLEAGQRIGPDPARFG